MNARLKVRLLQPVPTPVNQSEPLRLQRIAWGKPDVKMGRMVLRSIVETTPPIEVPVNTTNNGGVRAFLRSHGIH